MEENARQLAQDLVSEGKRSYIETFTIKDTEEKIVVIVQRVDKKRAVHLTEVTKAVSGPWGEACSCCNGSGRVG